MTRARRSVLAFGLFLVLPIRAEAQGAGAVTGFGGVSINGSESGAADLGGTLSFQLTPGVELLGEVGRVGNILPALSDTVFGVTNSGLRASAFYGEGGVRFRLAPHANISPYAEATAGLSRLSVTSTRFGPLVNGAASAALTLLGRTGPVAGVGGGVLFGAGPVVIDLGYRYKQFFPGEPLETVLGLGQPLRSHHLRAGFGVRF